MFALEDIMPWCTGFMGVIVALATFAWVGLYRLWRSQLRYVTLSGFYQKARMLFWLVVVAALSACSIVILWLLSVWIMLFMELFKG